MIFAIDCVKSLHRCAIFRNKSTNFLIFHHTLKGDDMTIVINLCAGPGVGKSTCAAYLYYLFKKNGKRAELVRECVKDWLYEGKSVGSFDQLYFLGEGIRRETVLYGKVDYVISDYPVLLNLAYARKYCSANVVNSVETMIEAFYGQARDEGHHHVNVLLSRVHDYVEKDRYESKEQALEIDENLVSILDQNYHLVCPDELGINSFYKFICACENVC